MASKSAGCYAFLMARSALLTLLGLVLAGTAALAWLGYGPRTTPAGQPPLSRLNDEGEVLRAFNADAHQMRLLVMLSPT